MEPLENAICRERTNGPHGVRILDYLTSMAIWLLRRKATDSQLHWKRQLGTVVEAAGQMWGQDSQEGSDGERLDRSTLTKK